MSTSGHPDNAYLGTAEGDLKKRLQPYQFTTISKTRHKWIKPP